MYWLSFIFNAALIVFAGTKLTQCADRFSEEFNIGKVWLGIILLGMVTSLPEAISSLSAVISLHAYDLAVGNLLGSDNFNLMLLVVMDLAYRRGAITDNIRSDRSNIVSAGSVVLLELIVIAEIIFSKFFSHSIFGCLNIGMLLIMVFFFIGMRLLYSFQADNVSEVVNRTKQDLLNQSRIKIIIGLILSAGVVIFAAMRLASSADIIAKQTGLGRTFVGSIFLACVTSLPEMVVSLSALKLGVIDMAAGNIFGSNMINIFIIAVCDLVSRGVFVLSMVSKLQILTASLGVILVCIAVIGIGVKHKRTYLGLGIDSILMSVLFLSSIWILYKLR